MPRKVRLIDQVAKSVEVWEEPVGFAPLVELSGDRRVLIEKHKGIQQYSPFKICVCVSFGNVAVCGSELKLHHMSKDQLIIHGNIENIVLTRRQK